MALCVTFRGLYRCIGSPRGGFATAIAIGAAVFSLDGSRAPSEQPMTHHVQAGSDAALGTYRQHCVTCHGKDGTGSRMREVMPQIPDFTSARWQKTRTDTQLALSIREGKGKLMPAFDDRINAEEAKDLVALIRSFNQSGSSNGQADPGDGPGSRADFETQFAQLEKSLRELRSQFQQLSAHR